LAGIVDSEHGEETKSDTKSDTNSDTNSDISDNSNNNSNSDDPAAIAGAIDSDSEYNYYTDPHKRALASLELRIVNSKTFVASLYGTMCWCVLVCVSQIAQNSMCYFVLLCIAIY
jgi:hypothetical protein